MSADTIARRTKAIASSMLLLLVAGGTFAQTKNTAADLDDIAITPSRHELQMEPGTERTVVVNIVFTSGSGKSVPARLMTYLNDWMITDGKVRFDRPGTDSYSASPWIIHTPIEMTVAPGASHVIRVTVSVPKDATAGDHTAALIVEPRPDNIKLQPSKKEVRTRFRLAAIFYIMVPNLTRKGSLQNLTASGDNKNIVVTPTIKNEGNSHIRPTHSVQILDQSGNIAAEVPEIESLPVLRGLQTALPLVIEKPLSPGSYSVRYRVNLQDGSPIQEGQTAFTTSAALAAETTTRMMPPDR